MSNNEVMTDVLYEETCRLYEQFRIANLNVRYYGSLAQDRKKRSTWLQVIATCLSLFALVILAAPEFRSNERLALLAAASSGMAAILAGAIPFFGLEDDTRKYSFLNRSYQIAENQIRDTLLLMRRSSDLTPELLGRASVLFDSMSRLQSLDEEDNTKSAKEIKDKLTKEVNDAFPADYVWNNL